MKFLLVGVVLLGMIFGIRWGWRTLRRRMKRAPSFVIPSGTIIGAAPLLTEDEVALYNLLQLVVKDQYLVLAQVPLWSFIAVDADRRARSRILRHMALKRVDFVLIHPGSCRVEYVVQIAHDPLRHEEVERQRVIESVLNAASIKLMTLQSKKSYSLPDLTARLELTAEQ